MGRETTGTLGVLGLPLSQNQGSAGLEGVAAHLHHARASVGLPLAVRVPAAIKARSYTL